MSEAFDSMKSGLEQAIAHAEGEPVKAQVHKAGPVDVKAIRSKVGMSQSEFAVSVGISLGTLRHWERGDRQPHGPAKILLNLLARDPNTVLKALRT